MDFNRVVFLDGVVDKGTMEPIWKEILRLDAISNEPIYFFIDSPGGYVRYCLALIDVMKAVKSPIHTVNIGMAASCGSLILAAGEIGKRMVMAESITMIHEVRGGDKASMKTLAGYNNVLLDILASHPEANRDRIELLAMRDTYLTTDITLDLKLADILIEHS